MADSTALTEPAPDGAAAPPLPDATDPIPDDIGIRPDAPRWACPWCAGVDRDRPGNCPSCGLALEPSALPTDADAPDDELRSLTWRLGLALLLAVPLLALDLADQFLEETPVTRALGMTGYLLLQAGLALPVVLVAGRSILRRGWGSLRSRKFNVFTLTALSVGAATLFSLVVLGYQLLGLPLLPQVPEATARVRPDVAGVIAVVAPPVGQRVQPYFDVAAVIVALSLLGQVLERRARSRTESAIRDLLRLAPKTARVVLPDGTEEERPLDLVRPGDLVRVRTGELIPVDGVVREGVTAVDEALITGEPLPAEKGPGMEVTAGTMNGLGVVTVEAVKVRGDTVLAHLISLIDRARRGRAPLRRAADRLAARSLPVVLLAAAGTLAAWWLGPTGSLTVGLVCAVGVLVVACPVALGLAAPTAVVAALGRAARAGVLFRDGAALERLAAVDTVLFDKTGTLTEGKMKLLGVTPNVGESETEVLALTAAAERGSGHPVGLAVVWEAVRRNLPIPRAEAVETVPGKGVRAVVDGRRVAVGSPGFLLHSGVSRHLMMSDASAQRAVGNSVVFVGRGDTCIGMIVLKDPPRPNNRAAADALRASGVELVLLTGDHPDLARGVAAQAAITEVIADTAPVAKFAVVQRLKNEGRVVAMCGDGTNDAPALAAADVGIAMGTGTEAAITIAGVALARPDLRGVAFARGLSRATVRTIRRNLVAAFAYTAVAVPLAAGALFPLGGGPVSPVWQAVGMTVVALVIVGNSLRLGSGGKS